MTRIIIQHEPTIPLETVFRHILAARESPDRVVVFVDHISVFKTPGHYFVRRVEPAAN
jgi:hypothetical protein